MSHPAGGGSAFPTIPCNAHIFLLDLEKSPQIVLKPSHSSCVTCFLLSESLLSPILLLQLFSMAGFRSHPCQQIAVPMSVREEQVISWEIVPQTQRFYMK